MSDKGLDAQSHGKSLWLKEFMRLEPDDLAEDTSKPVIAEEREDNFLITKFEQEHGVSAELQPPKLEEFMSPSPD